MAINLPLTGVTAKHSSAFGNWLRRECSADFGGVLGVTDVDYVIHAHAHGRGVQKVMLVEEKCRMKPLTFPQSETLLLLDQALRMADGQKVRTYKGLYPMRYYGFHLLQFEATCPDDGAIFWDERRITAPELIALFKFEDAMWGEIGK